MALTLRIEGEFETKKRVFIEHSFQMEFILTNTHNQTPAFGKTAEVHLELRKAKDKETPLDTAEYCFTCKPSLPLRVSGGKRLEATVKMEETHKTYFHDELFVFRASFKQEDGETTVTWSEPFSIVRYVLHVEPIKAVKNDKNSDLHVVRKNGVFNWYKDEGGTGNGNNLALKVSMRDGEGRSVQRNIPVGLLLCYEDGNKVANQDLLQMRHRKGHHKVPLTLGEDGSDEFLFRIGDVSSKHNRKRFCIKVYPNTNRDTSCGDIGSAWSSKVFVKSKRTGKNRPRENGASSTAGSTGASNPRPTQRRRRTQQTHMPVDLNVEEIRDPIVTKEVESYIGTNACQDMNKVLRRDKDTAERNLVAWAKATKAVFERLQFGVVGCERDAAGAIIRDRVIKRCPSCWANYGVSTTESGECTPAVDHKQGCTLKVLLDLYESDVRCALAHIEGKDQEREILQTRAMREGRTIRREDDDDDDDDDGGGGGASKSGSGYE